MSKEAILCVDDDATILSALRTILGNHLGKDWLFETAESAEEALDVVAELASEGVALAVVISDYIMPGMKGDALLVALHQQYPDAIKIMLTGQSDLKGVSRAINEANLYRFMEKPFNNADMLLTVREACRVYQQSRELERQNAELTRINAELSRMNTELEQIVGERTRELVEKNQALERLSITDRLTGLYNRVRLEAILEEEFARAERYRTSFSLVMVDVDHFKLVNDNFGHEAGDQVLIDFAKILHDHVRRADVVGRWGGEEFLVICREAPLDVAKAVAEKLRQIVDEHDFPAVGHKTSSFGVAAYAPGDTIKSIMQRADAALYRAKSQGRNRVVAE